MVILLKKLSVNVTKFPCQHSNFAKKFLIALLFQKGLFIFKRVDLYRGSFDINLDLNIAPMVLIVKFQQNIFKVIFTVLQQIATHFFTRTIFLKSA
jgi:hypothetical protein